MKQTVKVSINRMPFILDEDAYKTLKAYLDQLTHYYRLQPNGTEVVDGIEERISELLCEHTAAGENVISLEQIRRVLEIMGTPERIEEESTGEPEQSPRKPYSRTYAPSEAPQKRLYRNLDNRVIGGVFSGMAAYLKCDVAVFRVLAVVLLMLGPINGFTHVHFHFMAGLSSFVAVAYLIFWCIIPGAHTVEEKCAMHGIPFNAQSIHNYVQETGYSGGLNNQNRHNNSRFWYVVGRILAILFGLILLALGGAFLLAIVASIIGMNFILNVIPWDFVPIITDMSHPVLFNICCLIAAGIPIFGLIYGGCALIFKLRQSERVGVIAVIIWVLSLVGCSYFGTSGLNNFKHRTVVEKTTTLSLPSDTLYVKFDAPTPFPGERYYLNAQDDFYKLGWLENRGRKLKVIGFPFLYLEDSPSREVYIKSQTYTFAKNASTAKMKGNNAPTPFSLDGNTLTISAIVANRAKPWNGQFGTLNLYAPKDLVVIVQEPVYYEFGKGNRFSSTFRWDSDLGMVWENNEGEREWN